MLNSEKKVTVEWLCNVKGNDEGNAKVCGKTTMSNPITNSYSDTDKISLMVTKILHEELPMLEHNSLLKDLVMYSLLEKMKTVQSVENVLSYIKENNAQQVHDVSFKNGEVRIKCST